MVRLPRAWPPKLVRDQTAKMAMHLCIPLRPLPSKLCWRMTLKSRIKIFQGVETGRDNANKPAQS
eukprot:3021344-Amphidinium_carterae.1